VFRKHDPSSEVIELLDGIGRMLQMIDAKLQRIVELLEEDYE